VEKESFVGIENQLNSLSLNNNLRIIQKLSTVNIFFSLLIKK